VAQEYRLNCIWIPMKPMLPALVVAQQTVMGRRWFAPFSSSRVQWHVQIIANAGRQVAQSALTDRAAAGSGCGGAPLTIWQSNDLFAYNPLLKQPLALEHIASFAGTLGHHTTSLMRI
jgi:hypothetical protein